MQLVVDTNILISFFRENPVRFIIINSDFLGVELFTPEYAIEELKKNESDVLKYAKINSEQFNEALSDLFNFIKIFPKELFEEFESEAKQLIHDKDVPIFALALKFNCAIWSNEPSFKKQSSVKIFNTEDLRKFVNLI
jgi:predicted nucleic acid-binding protein